MSVMAFKTAGRNVYLVWIYYFTISTETRQWKKRKRTQWWLCLHVLPESLDESSDLKLRIDLMSVLMSINSHVQVRKFWDEYVNIQVVVFCFILTVISVKLPESITKLLWKNSVLRRWWRWRRWCHILLQTVKCKIKKTTHFHGSSAEFREMYFYTSILCVLFINFKKNK